MFEPCVDRRRKDQICCTELLDPAKSLKFRCVDQFDFETAKFNVAVDGVAAGQNLAAKFRPKSPGVWELTLATPITQLARGRLEVSVSDRQGNVTRIERTISVGPPVR